MRTSGAISRSSCGTARSWAERDEAEHMVWNFPGITRVDNEIAVPPE
jgi:osmotically-inducible protein OsmY